MLASEESSTGKLLRKSTSAADAGEKEMFSTRVRDSQWCFESLLKSW